MKLYNYHTASFTINNGGTQVRDKLTPVPGAANTSTYSDASKGHAVGEMSTDGIPFLGHGGKQKKIEQGSNNEKK